MSAFAVNSAFPADYLHFEDFTIGQNFTGPSRSVSKQELLDFSRQYDFQAMHVDEEAAKGEFIGEFIGSGWHTGALCMRLMAENFILKCAAMGALGIDEGKWLKPLRPNDTLSLTSTVMRCVPSSKRDDRGYVYFHHALSNQNGEVIYSQENATIFAYRTKKAPDASAPQEPRVAAPTLPPAIIMAADAPHSGFFEDIPLGSVINLGSYTFSQEEIIHFATEFDPQSFHIDIEAGKKSQFGGIISSGWLTAAVWMKQMLTEFERRKDIMRAKGLPTGRLGPSPGFRNMKWYKPVYPGDTLTFTNQVIGKRDLATLPKWGMMNHYNSATNQHGELVYEFYGAAFVERRPTA